jgi:adenylosuccinate lyase
MTNTNILSQRYASSEMNFIFSEENRILSERDLWIAVMKAQNKSGVDIQDQEIEKFEAAKKNIDFNRIKEIEKITKHDVKARIQAFIEGAQAGEYIHIGMTSRDLTDNVEQMLIKKASKLIFGKYLTVLKRLVDKAQEYRDLLITTRTHHQPAQPGTLGRRFLMWAEELYYHLVEFETFINNYPLRGIKGPVGTQVDMANVIGYDAVSLLEKEIADSLGFKQTLSSCGQVYYRSLDFSLISKLCQLSSACESFSKTLRLMSGSGLISEGFKEGQVGSSAMPHKMNSRTLERICGFCGLLKMYLAGAAENSGNQWEEGDVSCSVIRRVIIPDSFYASDGICESILNVLENLRVFPKAIESEFRKFAQFTATTRILTEAVSVGIGREEAHEIIKNACTKEALKIHEGNVPDIAAEISNNPVFSGKGMTKDRILSIINRTEGITGRTEEQITQTVEKIMELVNRYPEEADYKATDVL